MDQRNGLHKTNFVQWLLPIFLTSSDSSVDYSKSFTSQVSVASNLIVDFSSLNVPNILDNCLSYLHYDFFQSFWINFQQVQVVLPYFSQKTFIRSISASLHRQDTLVSS